MTGFGRWLNILLPYHVRIVHGCSTQHRISKTGVFLASPGELYNRVMSGEEGEERCSWRWRCASAQPPKAVYRACFFRRIIFVLTWYFLEYYDILWAYPDLYSILVLFFFIVIHSRKLHLLLDAERLLSTSASGDVVSSQLSRSLHHGGC